MSEYNVTVKGGEAVRLKTAGKYCDRDVVVSSPAEIINHADIPDYVKEESLRVANLVDSVRTDDSIVFLSMADPHHVGEQTDTSWREYQNTGNWHAAQAAKVLAYALNMDFACHLGDLTFGHGTTTSAQLHQQVEEMAGWLDESQTGIPAFWTAGNHDTGMYAEMNGNATLESASYLFSVFGARCEGATYGSTEYGYCYRDFEQKKLRVICLNSSELDISGGYGTYPSISEAQLLWFANTLAGVGSKSGWSIVVLSHYPLDYALCYPLSHVVKAYVEGGSVTHNGTKVSFSGKNAAKFVAAFHGHTHCFKWANLNAINASALTSEEYDAWRVAVPGSGYYRNNHQVESDKHGISFKDDVTYDKSIGGAKDTAFTVNVICPSIETVYSFTYGAGPEERVIGYGAATWYSISKTVSNATVSNSDTRIMKGKSYSATITVDEGCELSTVSVKMGGVDITSTAYADGVITIGAVTGDVEIIAQATMQLSVTNQLPISTDANGNIYNGKGWKENTYLSSGNDGTRTGIYATGFIPIIPNQYGTAFFYCKNVGMTSGQSNHRIAIYNADKSYRDTVNTTATGNWFTFGSDGNVSVIQVNSNKFEPGGFIRICCGYLGTDSIITSGEPIE